MKASVRQLAHAYLRERVARGEITALSGRNHRSALELFAEVVGDKPVVDITARDVERWLETRQHLRQSTRRSQFSYVKSFCAWLVRRGALATNPVAQLPAPRPPLRVPRALPRPSVERLLAAAPDLRGRAIVWLML